MAVSISLSITQNNQNITNNTSNVTVKVTANWTNGSNNRVVNASGTPQANGWVKIDGTSYNFASTFNDSVTTTGSKVICTKTVNVTHNTDGKKTLSCSASYTTGVSSGTVTATASKTLTTIPRKSTMSVGNGTLGTAQTLSVTRQSSSFTHTITAKCGSASSTICTKSTSTSISFTPPLSWASQNTTGTSLSVTYTITTYNGSTSLGNNTYTKTCSIPSSVKPSCRVSVSDATTYYSTYGGYIKGYSKFKVTVTPTLAYSSPIASYKTTANGATYTSASFTTDILKSSGNLTISATVTDKRGRTSSAATATVSVLDYTPPNISKLSVGRCDADGTPNDQGEYIQVTFAYSISSLNGKNTDICYLFYKKSSDPVFDNQTPDFDPTKGSYIFKADTGSSYDIDLHVVDRLDTTIRSASASTAFTIMHWKANGRGMGLGKVSELDDVLDINFQTRLLGGIMYVLLPSGTDLDDCRTPGFYVGDNIGDKKYVNLPETLQSRTSDTFTLEVLSMGINQQVMQRLTVCHSTTPAVFERVYYVTPTYPNGYWSPWTGEWHKATITGTFEPYNSNDTKDGVRYRKDGRVVEVRGVIKPTQTIPVSTSDAYHEICKLPEQYRPDSVVYTLCQGSGACVWLLRIEPNGQVLMARYRDGTGLIAMEVTDSFQPWLPFHVTYLV